VDRVSDQPISTDALEDTMSSASKYPIAELLSEIISEHASCDADFVTDVLGYRDVAKGLRRIYLWYGSNGGHQRIINHIARVTGRGEELERAIAATREMTTREWEESWLERCKAEAATFRPFLCATGAHSVPTQICIFGMTGGHRRWTMIETPQSVLDLSVEDLVPALLPYMHLYKQQNRGNVPFFGTMTGFRFVRLVDYFQFDADGNLVELVDKPFRLGSCSVSLV
jgi:hypothetical protein